MTREKLYPITDELIDFALLKSGEVDRTVMEMRLRRRESRERRYYGIMLSFDKVLRKLDYPVEIICSEDYQYGYGYSRNSIPVVFKVDDEFLDRFYVDFDQVTEEIRKLNSRVTTFEINPKGNTFAYRR